MYALLFRDHGLSPAAISSLFLVWSATSFVLEIPSGAWGDSIERRTLLALSGLVYAAAFGTWVLWPSYLGFLVGFVLWGLSSAMASGTFEALLYDSLAGIGAGSRYAQVTGWAHSAAMTANLVATGVAAPLFAVGGYQLVGWLSVAVALGHGCLALLLPRSPRRRGDGVVDAGRWVRRYVDMLGAGTAEAARVPVVRRALLVSAAMVGFTAYDEYFPLVLGEHGFGTGQVPLLLTLIVAAQALGTALAGRTSRWAPGAVAAVYGAGAALLCVGAVSGRPVGFLLIVLGFGLVNNAFVVSEARLQQVIEGPARATVTSVAGVSSEMFALAAFATVALGSVWWSVAAAVAVLAVPSLGAALLAVRWLPEHGEG